MPPTPFKNLIENVQQYSGENVILGGYILEIENQEDETILLVLQTPLSLGQRPSPKHNSEGRFVVLHDGYLDPELFQKDKRITVAGKIVGTQKDEAGKCIIPCLKIDSVEVYLWPEYQGGHHPPLLDPFYTPFTLHPYYWHFHYRYNPLFNRHPNNYPYLNPFF